ncbi:hypothetical protein AB0G54_10860 [Streptomyces yokosukanensis]|uniref:hypothetical protein n=1 Tax=Streptomyces yokosukanensis TaxID=67386 RepID=UPI0034444C0B
MELAHWDRRFKIWAFGFGYSRLLLRSIPKRDQDVRVEVLFSNVRQMNIAAQLPSLSIEEADFQEERNRLHIEHVPVEPFKLFILNHGQFHVLANSCEWHEDHEWIDAPSHFGPFRGVD